MGTNKDYRWAWSTLPNSYCPMHFWLLLKVFKDYDRWVDCHELFIDCDTSKAP